MDNLVVNKGTMRAYQDVFGREGFRSANQEIVWNHLKHTLHLERGCFIVSIENAPDFKEKKMLPVRESYDPIAAALIDGRRAAMIIIKGIVESPYTNKADEV